MKITTENIQVGFHARQILKGISMESQDKELVGIIGPNGSGKSTLLKCIYRILKPDAGAVNRKYLHLCLRWLVSWGGAHTAMRS